MVGIVRGLIERPMKSEVVRRSASRVSEVATARRSPAGSRATDTLAPPPSNGNGSGHYEPGSGEVLLAGPRRTYSAGGGERAGGRFRRVHLRLAVVTGLLAFLIAAVALTVPELLFGRAVGSEERTTFFGGEQGRGSDAREGSDRGQPEAPKDGAPPPAGGDSEPAPATPEAQPQDPANPPQDEPAEPPSGAGAPAPQPAPATP